MLAAIFLLILLALGWHTFSLIVGTLTHPVHLAIELALVVVAVRLTSAMIRRYIEPREPK